MTFCVYIADFLGNIWLKRRFFDQFCGHFMSLLWVEGLCRGVQGKGTKSRFLGLSERFGDYILHNKLVVDDIWRIYRGFSGNIWLEKSFF